MSHEVVISCDNPVCNTLITDPKVLCTDIDGQGALWLNALDREDAIRDPRPARLRKHYCGDGCVVWAVLQWLENNRKEWKVLQDEP